MRSAMLILACIMFCHAPASAEVPKQYIGTWVLDVETTGQVIANHPDLSDEIKQGWETGATDLIRYEWLISEGEMLSTITTHSRNRRMGSPSPESGLYGVELDQENPDHTLLAIVKYGGSEVSRDEGRGFHLQLMEDGSLRIREKKGGDWDRNDAMARHFVWRKEGGGVAAGDTTSNDAVAYLDALKNCMPGEFRLSAPGLGESVNTIVGRVDDRCRVKIVHTRISMDCAFSDGTIMLLTSPEKYDQARSGQLEGSTDSAESDRVSRECKVQ